MNLQNSKIVNLCIKATVFFLVFTVQITVKAWDLDFSRRQKDMKSFRQPASVVDQPQKPTDSVTGSFFQSLEPSQDIVILHTEKGFVPETVRLKKGGNYRLHVVNVNGKEKNSSFILDAFSEHHATYFGEEKSFQIAPKVDGIFSFVSPESGSQGRLVIFSDDRKPASQ